MARPKKFDRQAVMLRLLDEMAKGTRTLNQICDDPDMPNAGTIYLWAHEDELLSEILTRAQLAWCFAQNGICIQIADDDSRDVLEETIETDAGTITRRRSDNTAVNRDNLRVKARQWSMAKLAGKLFGEKQEVEHSGAVSVTPVINLTTKTK